MKLRELTGAKIGRVKPPFFEHINRQIPPEPHTAMYVWHKYWSRKTWNVVGEFIKTYTRPNDVIFDPFAGSGVTAIEAIRHGAEGMRDQAGFELSAFPAVGAWLERVRALPRFVAVFDETVPGIA